jgi:putative ABC transport system permease protein
MFDFGRRLLGTFRRDRLARELDEEIQAHFEALRQDLEDDGHAPRDAARLARLRLGGAVQIREQSQDEWRLTPFEGFFQDIKLAARSLRRRPGFATAAIATLALGIGASSAIFSVAYGVALRPLPYPDSSRLVRIYESNPAANKLRENASIGTFDAWRSNAPSIESAALYTDGGIRYLAGADGQGAVMSSVSPAFFDVLGVRPMIGPGFKPEDQYTRFTADDEAVISHGAWQRLLGGRPDVIGASLEFTGVGDNDIYRIVGVTPPDFAFGTPVDVWRPTMLIERPIGRLLRNWRYEKVVARLREGRTLEQARAELEAASAQLAQQFPVSNAGWTVTVETLHDSIIGNFGRASWFLLAAVAVVLITACLNVGGLLVARAVARERETAIRVALGAGSWRLLRLWFAEAALLAVTGAVLGVFLADLGVDALRAAAPPGIPRLDAIALDWPSLLWALLATALAIVVFTAAPLRGAPREQVVDGLRSGAAGGGDAPGRQATRMALAMAQCAGAAALVILAIMLTRSFVKLTSVDLGWNAAGVLSLRVDPPMPRELRRPWFRYIEWSDRLIARLESTPGIRRAAITTRVPFSTQTVLSTVGRGRGRAANDPGRWPGQQHNVTDGYFQMMGIRLISGRTFTAADRFSEQAVNFADLKNPNAGGVAVVSETLAKTVWPGQIAEGQFLWLPDIDNVAWRQVVGVVEDLQFTSVGEQPALHVFVPWTQESTGNPRLLVRADGDPAAIIAVVKNVLEQVEPGTRVDSVATLDTLHARATAQPRFTSRLVLGFGALALALAAVGIYGTLSYLVTSRLREIGIRLALGAPRTGIMSHVLTRGLVPAFAGGGIGLAIALGLARIFRSLLFGIEPLDPLSFAGGALVLSIVALAAALGPARRAARVDPVTALRMD